ncbi:nicotinate phosphoribosyltransferase [Pedosphaera parvula]|uniref:Nicotinate phosphoribosyltransferase n=1 Tax=Pedosphaera parvula (strain Ellin514) TaxID=320771 RepID=B9XDY3_PEDPL|nr:nicotinate phosphoribosyltransferase [Pedosphaera parvula]EEF61874.1 nicotinate phosphoribosyltransferase [Pedosphaera parvula Ellin514]
MKLEHVPLSAAGNNLVLLTDLYQLTMAYSYWKTGNAEREAVFHLSFRNNPFHGGFSVACGLAQAAEFIKAFKFSEGDLSYLAEMRGNDDKPLFETAFFDYLRNLRLACDLDAILEGTVVFGHEPLLRVRGPLLQCQLLETVLLNIINFQTLIATKAARVCLAAKGDPVIEFGLRRAQGNTGALIASRACYVGGCEGTSNVLAGRIYDIPVKGTHAHSWVMAFDDELTAFRAYAAAMPNNCIFLVDTYNSLEGIKNAIKVGLEMRQRGHEMIGIRLDSGDLAYLSIEARKLLDDAGFPNARILASNDLDEHIIASLKEQGSKVDIWGVGTKLVTAYDQPALGGVYKLSALRNAEGEWDYKLKLSEQVAKVSTPGIHQVRRFHNEDGFIGDVIYDCESPLPDEVVIVDPTDFIRRKHIPAGTPGEDLLQPIFRKGRLITDLPGIHDSRERTKAQLNALHPGIKRFVNPHDYPAGLELGLHELKTQLILKARGEA